MKKLDKVNFLFLNFYSDEKTLNLIILYLNYLSIENELNISILHKDKNCQNIFEKNLIKSNFKNLIIKKNLVISNDIKNINQELTNHLIQNKIDVVNMFNGSLTVYDIDEKIIILDRILKKEKIKFYWVSMSFLRGKFNLSEDIYFKNDEIFNSYKNLMKNPLSIVKENLLKKYIVDYWNFKKNVQNANVTVKSKLKLNDLMNLKFLLRLLVNQLKLFKIEIYKQYKKNYILNKFDNSKIINSYILFLGTKPNHWFNKYANKNFKDPSTYINNIIRSIPKTHSLIVKPHPRDESLLLRMPLNKRNIFYTGDLKEIIEKADLVISTGSASVFEALTLNKKIIHLGSRSYLGDVAQDLLPICIVDNISHLKETIEEEISTPLTSKKIKAYLLALLQHSYNFNDYEYSLTRNNQFIKKAANELFNKIKRNTKKK